MAKKSEAIAQFTNLNSFLQSYNDLYLTDPYAYVFTSQIKLLEDLTNNKYGEQNRKLSRLWSQTQKFYNKLKALSFTLPLSPDRINLEVKTELSKLSTNLLNANERRDIPADFTNARILAICIAYPHLLNNNYIYFDSNKYALSPKTVNNIYKKIKEYQKWESSKIKDIKMFEQNSETFITICDEFLKVLKQQQKRRIFRVNHTSKFANDEAIETLEDLSGKITAAIPYMKRHRTYGDAILKTAVPGLPF